MEEMKMTRYDKDTSAAAVVLFDYGEAYISTTVNNISLNFERQVRIKILKREGLEWADVAIRLLDIGTNEENVSGLKAFCYNLENGNIVETKLSKDGIFKEAFNKNVNLLKFTIPNVREGSVIEYTYKINSDFLSNFPDWQFQYKIPVVHSEYWAIIPEFFTFQKYMQGYLAVSDYNIKPISSGSFQSQAHHWVLKDVPAFQSEPYMTSEADYVSKIKFALSHFTPPGGFTREIMGSWEKMNHDLLESESFGKAISGSGYLKKIVEEITTGLTDPLQKVAAIHSYVKSNVEWNGTKDYLTYPIKKVLDEKKGTSGDINITLASMLQKAGIPVEMVLLSTRDHGFIRREVPMERQFNYVVCEVNLDGKSMMIDATQRYLPMDVLPERCLNQIGFRVSATNPGWVEIKPAARARKVLNARLTLDPQGALSGALTYTLEGYEAGRARVEYLSKGEAEYLKSALNPTWQITSSSFEGITEVNDAVKATHEVAIPEHSVVAGDVIYINPFVAEQLTENPFKLEERQYPVDFGSPLERTYVCQLTIPENYQVDEIPESKIFVTPGNSARYVFNAAHMGNTITISSSMRINKNLFIQTEYQDLREFYHQVVAKQAEQIVLKRAN